MESNRSVIIEKEVIMEKDIDFPITYNHNNNNNNNNNYNEVVDTCCDSASSKIEASNLVAVSEMATSSSSLAESTKSKTSKKYVLSITYYTLLHIIY